MLIEDMKLLSQQYKRDLPTLAHNAEIFDIFEGNLLPYVLEDLKAQLSPEAFKQTEKRVPPINLLRRVVDKLSRLYVKPPIRKLVDGNETDEGVFDFYLKALQPNVSMTLANEFFNLFKNTAVEPYLDRSGAPKLRVVPSDRFFVVGTDPVDPQSVTHFVKLVKHCDVFGKEKVVFYVYTDEEFLITNEKGEVIPELMAQYELDGSNPYGRIPYTYIVRSNHNLMPVPDSDTLRMTKLFPIMMSDLNLATMYQSFSILYGVDLDSTNLKMSPNAFWQFKSDPTSQKEPKLGMIKPEVSSGEVMNLIMQELALWLQSKNIRPGQVGQAAPEQFSSGVSKMVDEMDTSEDRQKQIPFFKQAEEDLWDLILHYMHPVWRQGDFPEKRLVSSGARVEVAFHEQLPNVPFGQVLDEVIKQRQAGLMTVEMAIGKLYPDTPEDARDELMREIVGETTVEIPSDEEANQEASDEETSNEEASEENLQS
jgi:hypothetical protein